MKHILWFIEMIKKLKIEDVGQVVKIHKGELNGFLSDLGEEFLQKFYEATLSIPEIFTLIEKENEQIKGFATGAVKVEGLYKRVFWKKPFSFAILLLNNFVTHPDNMIRIVRSLTYPGFEDNIPELLTIAVVKNHQGKGIGGKLFREISKEIKKRRFGNFRVSIYDGMGANKFYEKMGGRREKQFEFLDKKMNYYNFKLPKELK